MKIKKKTKVMLKRVSVIVVLLLMCLGMALQLIGYKIS